MSPTDSQEYPEATFRRMDDDTWAVQCIQKRRKGATVTATRADGTTIKVTLGSFLRKIEECAFVGGGPAWLYAPADTEAKETQWPPRLTIAPGGVISLWCEKHGFDATREQVEELCACFGLTYDGTVGDDAPAPF